MAFDIYAGSLARYYAGDWENQMARHAREQNMPYKIIRPTEEPEEENLSTSEIIEIVQNWYCLLSKTLQTNVNCRENFQEEYFTARLNDFGVLSTANCYLYALNEPISILNDPIASKKLRKTIEKESGMIYFSNMEAWLPIELPGSGIYEINFPNNVSKLTSSTSLLIQELEAISKRIFNLSLEQLTSTKPRTELVTLQMDMLQMYKGALFSMKHNVPMLLDY